MGQPSEPAEPETPEQWQRVADLCEALLNLDAMRQYGLAEGGPAVNASRCRAILSRAAARGIAPRAEPVEAIIRAMAGG